MAPLDVLSRGYCQRVASPRWLSAGPSLHATATEMGGIAERYHWVVSSLHGHGIVQETETVGIQEDQSDAGRLVPSSCAAVSLLESSILASHFP